MKQKTYFLAMIIAGMSAVSAFADKEVVGDYVWYYRVDGDGAVIERKVDRLYDCAVVPNKANPTNEIAIPSELGGKMVVRIADLAFYGFLNAEKITIPASIKEIGSDAFYGCMNLAEFSVEEDSKSFCAVDSVLYSKGMTKLIACPATKDNVKIPDTVMSIASSAFAFGKVEEIEISTNITSIGSYAFCCCSNLTTVTFAEGSKLSRIDDYVFCDCVSIASIILPEGLEKIGDYAFMYCGFEDGLLMTLPESLTHIGECAFCSSGITSKNWNITIPEHVEYIGPEAFSDCWGLAAIVVDKDNEYYSSDEQGILYNEDKTELIVCPIWATEGLGLLGITVPKTVKVIDDYAFMYSDASSITLPDGLHTIGYAAFWGCQFSEITIPGSVTKIGEGAFFECACLQSVKYLGNKPEVGYGIYEATPYNLISFVDKNKEWEEEDGCLPVGWPYNEQGDEHPRAIAYFGSPNVWKIGSPNAGDVTAYFVNGTLFVEGSGNTKNFADGGADAPWADMTNVITSVVYDPLVVPGDNIMDGFTDTTSFTVTRKQMPNVNVGGIASESALVRVKGGEVELGINVKMSDTLATDVSEWKLATPSAVRIEEGTVIITVPASGDCGFYTYEPAK